MKPSLAPCACLVAALVACGSSVDPDSGGTSSGGGGGGTTTGTTTSTTSTTSTSSEGGAGGGTGGGSCSGYVDVAADNGAPTHYATFCSGGWGSGESSTAVGYLFEGGPAPGVQVFQIVGCLGAGPGSEGITLGVDDATAPGTYTKGSTQWIDPGGGAWGVEGDPFDVTITKLDPVGGVVEGTFSAMVTHGGNAAHALSGAFHVCRVSDMLAP